MCWQQLCVVVITEATIDSELNKQEVIKTDTLTRNDELITCA
jgi:hypothetical protein